MTAKAPATGVSDKAGLYGGLVLGLSAIAALIVANSPLGPDYEALLRTTGEVRIGSIGLSKTVDHWINDGLMAVFFLLVGLEIKREAIEGALSSAKQAALPVIAAFGGFVTPAAIFAAVNWGDAHALRGWAIPAATDIAFALGVCAMLGRKVPASLKIFLLALAIIDDLMAIIVIAIFYTADLSVTALALGGLGVAALAVLNLLDVRRPSFYLIAGLFTWVCVLKSGVHATLAGVAVGLAMPLTRRDGHSLLEDTEHALRPWVIFAIVPIFAFANAGVSLHGLTLSNLAEPIPLGIIAGLFVGKQIGVFVASMLAIRLGLAAMPEGTTTSKALCHGHPDRHRLHHEPFHRHAGVRRRGGAEAGPARRPHGFAAVRHRRRADVFRHREVERNFRFAMTTPPGETPHRARDVLALPRAWRKRLIAERRRRGDRHDDEAAAGRLMTGIASRGQFAKGFAECCTVSGSDRALDRFDRRIDHRDIVYGYVGIERDGLVEARFSPAPVRSPRAPSSSAGPPSIASNA